MGIDYFLFLDFFCHKWYSIGLLYSLCSLYDMERFYHDAADFRILVIVLYMIYMERFYSHTADFRVLVVWGELSLCEKLFYLDAGKGNYASEKSCGRPGTNVNDEVSLSHSLIYTPCIQAKFTHTHTCMQAKLQKLTCLYIYFP